MKACFNDATCLLAVAVLALSVLPGPLPAQETLPDGTQAALQQIQTLRIPPGLQMELFAAEPQLSGPVAFCLDERGRVFVAEEYRFNRGTEENRTRPFVLNDDLQIDTVDDRLAMYRKFADKFAGGTDWFTRVADQIRLVEDRDGDGRADASRVFTQFKEPLDGLAAGVLARDGDIYVTCIPHLWRLRDDDNDGQPEVRQSLHRGFGVNCAFLGHDLHGLVFGPDGRLYFSVGDRGFHVKTQEGVTLRAPRRGGVFRCDPDGANLELVHVGLRNPQELAFDEFGNLFAADNNCDKGDLSRLVYVVEGGDSGWNMAYQTIADPYLTGPWHAEKLWHVEATDQPAWIVPPVGSLGAGPSGFVYYPGLGLPDRYREHFFLCNYTGDGGIESFALKPQGASFRIIDAHDFLKPVKATDVDFGYDGKMYVLDFVNLDWSGKSLGGRIYTLFDQKTVDGAAASEMKSLFAQGIGTLPTPRLMSLLGHEDMRLRLRAQYALAERKNMISPLHKLAASPTESPLARRHAIWALWQIGRSDNAATSALRELLATDQQQDIHIQAMRALGDLRDARSAELLVNALAEDSPRLRFMAAMALGRLTIDRDRQKAIDAIAAMLSANADQDPYLRHAGVMALLGLADDAALNHLAQAEHRSVRLVALLVARRRGQDVSQFLRDTDLAIVTEAARAINDEVTLERQPKMPTQPVTAAEHALAALAASFAKWETVPEPLARRVIHANYRCGHAQALLNLAVADLTPAMRQEALACLALWSAGTSRDRVNGSWRPVPGRSAKALQKIIADGWADRLLTETSGETLVAAIGLLAQYEIAVDDQRIAAWAGDRKRDIPTRKECLALLQRRKSAHTDMAIERFLDSEFPELRSAGRAALAERDPAAAIGCIAESLEAATTTPAECQSSLAVLSSLNSNEADALILSLLKQYTPPQKANDDQQARLAAIELDVVTAAEARGQNQQIAKLLEAYREQAAKSATAHPLGEYRVALVGGDAARGEQIFRAHRQAQCMRCHKVRGDGGTAGPDLSQLGRRPDATRTHIVQSIIDPSAKIAKGFETTLIVTDAGRIFGGVVREEKDGWLVLETPQGRQERIALDSIDDRAVGRSAMPDVRPHLKMHEIRDLVEFLSQQKQGHSPH